MSDTRDESAGRPQARSPDQTPAENVRAENVRAENEAARPGEDASAAKISELEDRWRRAAADLDNYRKRTAATLERERAEERARTTAVWLPVLDDLERALEHADAEPDAVIQGIRSVLDHARQVIEQLGYPRRDDQGETFDPFRHEAISTVPDPQVPDGTVVRVLRPGYGEGRTQLRPAQVVVAKGHDDGPGP